ncbi:MAG: hypothetical protein U0487_01925 [Patescibacteria group bacterium]
MTTKQMSAIIFGLVLAFVLGLAAGHHVGHQAGYHDGMRHMMQSLNERREPPTRQCRLSSANEESALCVNAIDDDCDGLVDSEDPGCRSIATNATSIEFTVENAHNCQFVALIGNDGESVNADCSQAGSRIYCANVPRNGHFMPRMICR